jgi:Transposase DDE domain/Transposase DNA-binding
VELFTDFWVNEFRDLELSDARLNKRVISLLCSMSNNPGSAINNICRSKKEEKSADRLIDNNSFSPAEVLNLHYERTIQRCGEFETVFLVQDTTGFNFNHKSIEGMGRIGGSHGKNCHNKIESRGLYCHNLLAFSEAGEPLGILDQNIWARDKRLSPELRKNRPYEKKESYKWAKSLDKEELKHKLKTQFIVVSDRESDIGPYMGITLKKGFDFVIRVDNNRQDKLSKRTFKDLSDSIEQKSIISVNIHSRTIENTDKRKPKKIRYNNADQATDFEVKFASVGVNLESPGKNAPLTHLNLVAIKEQNPKKGTKPIEWLIATTLPVNTAQEAQKVVEIYRSRWKIEVYHKAQKSSCKIENSRLRNKDRLLRFILLQSLIAFGICRIKYLLDSRPEEPAENFFDKETIKIVWDLSEQRTKNKTVQVKDFIFMLANLEGYKSYNIKTPPGIILLAKAMRTLNTILFTYDYALKRKDVGKC